MDASMIYVGLDVHKETIAVAVAHRDPPAELEVSAVWVPDPAHEALRNLTRLRAVAHHDLTRARHRLSKFLLRSGCVAPAEAKPWTQRFLDWTRAVRLEQPLDVRVRDDYFNLVVHLQDRITALDQALEDAARTSPMARRIAALCTMRGVSIITATTLVAEWGEIARFTRPRQLMAYTGLVPSESSSGARTQRGGITQTGSSYLRRVLVESAFAYRHRPLLGDRGRRGTRDGRVPLGDRSRGHARNSCSMMLWFTTRRFRRGATERRTLERTMR